MTTELSNHIPQSGGVSEIPDNIKVLPDSQDAQNKKLSELQYSLALAINAINQQTPGAVPVYTEQPSIDLPTGLVPPTFSGSQGTINATSESIGNVTTVVGLNDSAYTDLGLYTNFYVETMMRIDTDTADLELLRDAAGVGVKFRLDSRVGYSSDIIMGETTWGGMSGDDTDGPENHTLGDWYRVRAEYKSGVLTVYIDGDYYAERAIDIDTNKTYFGLGRGSYNNTVYGLLEAPAYEPPPEQELPDPDFIYKFDGSTGATFSPANGSTWDVTGDTGTSSGGTSNGKVKMLYSYETTASSIIVLDIVSATTFPVKVRTRYLTNTDIELTEAGIHYIPLEAGTLKEFHIFNNGGEQSVTVKEPYIVLNPNASSGGGSIAPGTLTFDFNSSLLDATGLFSAGDIVYSTGMKQETFNGEGAVLNDSNTKYDLAVASPIALATNAEGLEVEFTIHQASNLGRQIALYMNMDGFTTHTTFETVGFSTGLPTLYNNSSIVVSSGEEIPYGEWVTVKLVFEKPASAGANRNVVMYINGVEKSRTDNYAGGALGLRALSIASYKDLGYAPSVIAFSDLVYRVIS